MFGSPEGGLKGRRVTEFFSRDLSQINPCLGIAVDQTSELVNTSTLIRMSTVSMGDDGERGETALMLQDITQEREREQERSQFLYHVTHELRTPLTNIRAYAETLSEGVLQDPDTLRECYNVIVGETQRLSRLVEDILSLSQMEAGAARLKMDDVYTARLVRQVVEDMQAQADDKGLELILNMPAKIPTIRGDKERLAVVLTNLVGNAIKYTPSGGRVEITCGQEGSRLHIRVVDTGLGIAPQERDKVFEKFYRSSDERVAALPGTGLGLALAMEIVRTHGGTITVESELGKGSAFTMVLPIGNLAAVQA
jgi:signal transduction histidine kinase